MRYFSLFLVLTLVCATIAIYCHADGFEIPKIQSFASVVLSLFLLVVGYMARVEAWRSFLRQHGFAVSFGTSAASIGMSVFGKYVPGKVGLVIGQAAYIGGKLNKPVMQVSVTALEFQVYAAWAALSVGAIGTCLTVRHSRLGWVAGTFWIAATILLFGGFVGRVLGAVRRRLPGSPKFPIKFSTNWQSLVGLSGNWALWTAAFVLFYESLESSSHSLNVAFAFPLAVGIGAIVAITPGGLGIREGVLVACLGIHGVAVQPAVSIAVAARIWFLVGEVCIFVVGATVHLFSRHSSLVAAEKD